MKVTRKLGRRNYSSVSRRRLRNKKNKSGYKKKYAKTQKGGSGKHGKRSRGHKRARTHKHGKRFHRGGRYHTLFDRSTPVKVQGMNDKGEIEFTFTFTGQKGSKRIFLENIRYLKGDDTKTRIDNFIVEITYTANNKILTIKFIRQDSKSEKVLAFTLPSSNRDNNVDNVLKELKGMENGILVGEPSVKYSFNETNKYPDGLDLFEKLSGAIRKAVTEYEDIYQKKLTTPQSKQPRPQHLQKQVIQPIQMLTSRPAPPGWEKIYDPEYGTYYQTIDEDPVRVSMTYPGDDSEASGALTASPRSDSSESYAGEHASSGSNDNVGADNGIDIGNGWKMYKDDETGKPYYHNTITNETTWDDPREKEVVSTDD